MFRIGLNICKSRRLIAEHRRNLHLTSNLRSGGVRTYRSPGPPPPLYNVVLAQFMGGLVWSWIFYRLIYDWHHLSNEWPIPDPSKWTDEELGVPALDD